MNVIKNFYEKHNLRPFESTWLLSVHILGVIGLVYAIIDYTLLPKIILTHCIFHNLYALGITTGAHRLWSHRAYKATNLWKAIIMLLNSGIFAILSQVPIKDQSSTGAEITDSITNILILNSIHTPSAKDSSSHMSDGS
jgi:hypothetical protein